MRSMRLKVGGHRGMDSDKLSALEMLVGTEIVDEVLADGGLETKEFNDGIENPEDGGIWAWDEETGGYIRLKAGYEGEDEDMDYDQTTAQIVQDIAQLLEVLPPDQRAAFAQEVQSVLLNEEKIEGGDTAYETMAGEIQRTINKIFPRNKTESKSYEGRSRLVGDGNTWLDRFATGRSIREKTSEALDEWLDSLPPHDEGWLDQWLAGEEDDDDG